MYSELMMREHGFDDDPRFRVMMHTDAIWRACRIILDVRMHRGELTVDEATDFLVEHTSFERAERAGRGQAGTRTARPTRCRTCSGGRCSSTSAPTSSARLGDAFSLRASTTRCCATARCRSASTAGCWPARAR